jgi:hypothetical protein
MHAIHFMLSTYIYTLFVLSYGAAAEAVPNAQLLPDGFFSFGDYEVLSVREEGDEDIVQIRKRTEESDCLSDCLDYSGWTESGTMQCSAEDVDDALDKRSLVKRSRKEETLCVYI